ncbi:beta family protein [Streptomyces prunicolor]
MVEPIYVPVLPTTRAATTAYAHVNPGLRKRIAPLWTILPRTGPERPRGRLMVPDPEPDEAALRHWLSPRVAGLIDVMEGMSGWVDATHVERLDVSAEAMWRLATTSSLRLVTGPERTPRQQRYAADLSFLSGLGLGIRVLLDDPPDEGRQAQLADLIDRLRVPPSHLDLLLDVGPIADTAEAGKKALEGLDRLGSLIAWRRVVITSGAFPRTLHGLDAQPTRRAERHDRQLYRALREARPDFPRTVLHGDYSVEHACRANIPTVRQPGPGWGLLRYTTPDSFLVARAPTRGPHRDDRARAMARWIVESDDFRGIDGVGASEAERWLYACAYGDGARNAGNAEKWIQVGYIQHLSFVVQSLVS